MAEDTETELIGKIKKNLNCLHFSWTNLQIFKNNGILLTYIRYIDHDKSDVKEDILSVFELPTYSTNSEIFELLNGFNCCH
jgi:hypothetical protein